jgi:hypothetical protein
MSEDKLGLSHRWLKKKALDFAKLEYAEGSEELLSFQASNGWLCKVLKRNRLESMTLHGEANDISNTEAEFKVSKFREDFHKIINEKSIPFSRIYNTDQSGLYYQNMRMITRVRG